jgi:U3 small nucleolar RNA-associated protein 12
MCSCFRLKAAIVAGNNQCEVVNLEVGEGEEEEGAAVLGRLDTPGHRSDVRTSAFSSDNTALLTASCESVKVREIRA